MNNYKNNNSSDLAMSSLAEIPTPNTNAKSITALVKKSGKVIGYEIANETIITKEEAISLARQGGIKGVGISTRNGSEYLKSLPDGAEDNNLDSLPTIKG